MRVSLALMQLPLSGRISMLMMALSQLLLFPKVINRQHTKIICPRRGMWLNKFLSNSKELQGLPLKIEQIVLKISTYWTMHCAFSGAESDTFRFRIVLQDKPLTQLESYQPSVLYTNPWDSLSTSNPDWKTSSLEPLPRRWERWRNRLHSLRETEDADVLQATYIQKPSLLSGCKQPWIPPVFLLASYRWHQSSPLQLCHGQGSSNSTENCYDPSVPTERAYCKGYCIYLVTCAFRHYREDNQ